MTMNNYKELKVNGLKVYYNTENIKIVDSYQINNKEKMQLILQEILEKIDSMDYKTNRSMKSLVKEWRAHNRMYKLHLFRKHTKDTDFEANQKLLTALIYYIIG